KQADCDQENGQCDDGMKMQQGQSTENGCVFAEAEGDIRERFRGCIGNKACRCLGGMGRKRSRAGEKNDHDIEAGTRMTEHLDCEERSTNWPDDGMNSVPCRIDPGNFIGEEFEQEEHASNGDDERIAQDTK
ncbi:MAG: hypothetical protein QOH24_783, partial [Verrucomicrobiota bacterium]